ncbi:LysR family transcriptional regulator [Actibacterium sp. D379-3]
MRPNFHQFAAFAHAAREGSLSRAAARIGVTQSAVTQHLNNLERTLGTRLLLRRRDGVELTRAGQTFYELADRLVTLDQLISEKIDGYRDLGTGHLSIIANAPRPALGYIAAYRARHPDVEIQFTLYDWTRAMRLLRERQVDLAIVTEPEKLDAFVSRPVGHARYVAYMRPDHPLAAAQQVSLADLAHDTVLLPEEGSFTERVVKRKLAAKGLSLTRLVRATTFPVMQEAVLHGVGIGLFLDDSAHPSTAIVTRPVIEMPEAHCTCVVTPADKHDLRLVQSFLDIVQ